LKECIIGSVDGRITRCLIVERSSGKFCLESLLIFKAHKKEIGPAYKKENMQYTINSLKYTNRMDVKEGRSFLSCGTDENFYIWDYEKKHRSLHFKSDA
jgi:hypothetical protein